MGEDTAGGGTPHIDVEKISSELKIRPEVYVRIVGSFVNSLPGKLNRLNEALSVNDRDQMRMILHEIKGTAGNLRLTTISAPQEVMHVAVKAGEDQKQLSRYFENLNTASQKLVEYFAKMLSANPE